MWVFGSRPNEKVMYLSDVLRYVIFFFFFSFSQSSVISGKQQGYMDECCTVKPNRGKALEVTCDCNHRLVSLGASDIPETAESVRVPNADVVIIHEDFLTSLPSLRQFILKNGKRLQIQTGALKSQPSSKPLMFIVDNFTSVDIHEEGLSGSWDPGSVIQFRNIGSFDIRRNAINFSSRLGPDVLLEGSKRLYLAPQAFNAHIRRLTLKNVSVDTCFPDTLVGNIHILKMNDVKIRIVSEKCIVGTDPSSVMDIYNSEFEIIRSNGIFGKIRTMKIQKSSITTVDEKGFNLEVDHLGIFGTRFGTLKTGALNVQAERSVILNQTTVGMLRRHALTDIKFLGSTASHSASPLKITKLTITKFERGSLSLSPEIRTDVDGLKVIIPDKFKCSPEEFTRWLVDKSSGDRMTTTDNQIVDQLSLNPLCPWSTAMDTASGPTESNTNGTVVSSGTTATDTRAKINVSRRDRQPNNTPVVLVSAGTATGNSWWLLLTLLVAGLTMAGLTMAGLIMAGLTVCEYYHTCITRRT